MGAKRPGGVRCFGCAFVAILPAFAHPHLRGHRTSALRRVPGKIQPRPDRLPDGERPARPSAVHLTHHILEWSRAALVDYGYWAVAVLLLLENAGLPVPGETVLLLASFLAYSKHE